MEIHINISLKRGNGRGDNRSAELEDPRSEKLGMCRTVIHELVEKSRIDLARTFEEQRRTIVSALKSDRRISGSDQKILEARAEVAFDLLLAAKQEQVMKEAVMQAIAQGSLKPDEPFSVQSADFLFGLMNEPMTARWWGGQSALTEDEQLQRFLADDAEAVWESLIQNV